MGSGRGNHPLDPVINKLYARCVEYDVMEVKEITYDNPDDLTIEIHLTKAMP